MKQIMVRYQVRPQFRELNESLVREVYAELDRDRPEGLRYCTFVLDDGVSFVHIAFMEGPESSNPLASLNAFARFQEGIAERLENPPVVSVLSEIGSYRVFGEGTQAR
jgi:hypothetical protein